MTLGIISHPSPSVSLILSLFLSHLLSLSPSSFPFTLSASLPHSIYLSSITSFQTIVWEYFTERWSYFQSSILSEHSSSTPAPASHMNTGRRDTRNRRISKMGHRVMRKRIALEPHHHQQLSSLRNSKLMSCKCPPPSPLSISLSLSPSLSLSLSSSLSLPLSLPPSISASLLGILFSITPRELIENANEGKERDMANGVVPSSSGHHESS